MTNPFYRTQQCLCGHFESCKYCSPYWTEGETGDDAAASTRSIDAAEWKKRASAAQAESAAYRAIIERVRALLTKAEQDGAALRADDFGRLYAAIKKALGE